MKKIVSLISLISLLFLAAPLFAAPAYQGTINFQQKDGSSFEGNLKGDEWFHWVEDKEGNIIKYNKESKNYEYGVIKEKDGELDLAPSGVTVGKKLSSPVSGMQKANQVAVEKIDTKTLGKIWKQKREKAKKHTRSK